MLTLRVLNFRDRDLVLRSRKLEALRSKVSWLMTFPDFSVETQKQSKSFGHVKLSLRQRTLKYSMLFPARLLVQEGESHRFFTSPEDAPGWSPFHRAEHHG